MVQFPFNIRFSFYGFGIDIKCQDPQTLQDIRRDYSFFIDNEVPAKIFFEVFNETPNYSTLPPLKAKLFSPRNICYSEKNLTYIDYFGKGLTIIDNLTNIYKIYCPEAHLRHEIIFLSVISLVGQDLDSKKMHRAHGLGIEYNNKAIILLMPSGGGKTTLLLELIKNDSIKFLSEDSPILDASGNALPFPIRIGINWAGKPPDIPEEHLHLAQRMEWGPKYLLDTAFFKDKISTKPLKVQYILCGTRCLGPESSIIPASKWTALNQLISNCVVGVKLYQGIEFLLQHGLGGLFKKGPLLLSRLKNVLNILFRCRCYTFVIGCDRAKNAKAFLNFCRENP